MSWGPLDNANPVNPCFKFYILECHIYYLSIALPSISFYLLLPTKDSSFLLILKFPQGGYLLVFYVVVYKTLLVQIMARPEEYNNISDLTDGFIMTRKSHLKY